MANIQVDVRDLDDLYMAIDKTKGITKAAVTPAVKSAMKPTLRLAQNKAPVDTGELQSSLMLRGEKTRAKAKKVYQIALPASKNNIFQKILPGKNGGKERKYYYPASQEYGWMMRNGQKHEGVHYMLKAHEERAAAFTHEVVLKITQNIYKVWKKKYTKPTAKKRGK